MLEYDVARTQIAVTHDLGVSPEIAPGRDVMHLPYQASSRHELMRAPGREIVGDPPVDVREHGTLLLVNPEKSGGAVKTGLRHMGEQVMDKPGVGGARSAHGVAYAHDTHRDATTCECDFVCIHRGPSVITPHAGHAPRPEAGAGGRRFHALRRLALPTQ